MTRLHKQDLICPHCINEQDVTIWDIIDTGQDPDLREEVMNKRIQSWVCTNCQREWVAAEPFLYHDPDQKLLFYYGPQFSELLREGVPEEQNLPQQIQDALPVEWAHASSDYTMRIMTEYNDLIEKIHTFEFGLDDRLIEVLKLALRTRQQEIDSDHQWEAVHFLAASGNDLVFSTYNEDDNWQAVNLEYEAYENAELMLAQSLPPEGRWGLVDMNWALRFVQADNPQ